MDMAVSEFQQMRACLKRAKMGSYLMIPLKYETKSFRPDRMKQSFHPCPITTMDLNEPVRELLNPDTPTRVGECYEIFREDLVRELFDGEAEGIQTFYVLRDDRSWDEEGMFDFFDSCIYLFHTQVAFLCLGIRYSRITTLTRICNPGFAENNAEYGYRDAQGSSQEFSLESCVSGFCARMGLKAFFAGSPMLLEADTYNVALVPQRFSELETMQRISFNHHRMVPLEEEMEDKSEYDVRYVYSVRNQELNTYRWGCCVSSQNVSWVGADETMDLEGEMHAQARDGLPMLAIALYEKYTCLHFTRMIASAREKRSRQIRSLKRLMLEFRAYGTVSPSNISRWHNIKKIYEYILETNGIPEAIGDIQDKLNILIERQQEVENTRNGMVAGVLTLFGAVSILDSVLAISQSLMEGGTQNWFILLATIWVILLVTVLVLVFGGRED